MPVPSKDKRAPAGRTPRALVLVALAIFSGAARPARLSSQTPRSSAATTLRAVVVTGDSFRTPLADAEVTLAASDASEGSRYERSATTGADGTCAFEGLPTGMYTLRAGKPGYVTTFFGATTGDDNPTPIAIGEREQPSPLEIRLPGGGAVSGMVRDTRGRPAAGATVLLMQFVGSERRFARMSDAATAGGVVRTVADSTGAYRLFGVPGGEYIVQATSVEQRSGEPMMSRAYYPGTADVIGASIVNLAGGEESLGIDFQLQPVSLADVSGAIVPPTAPTRRRLRMIMFPQGLFSNLATELDARAVVASTDGLFSNPVKIAQDGTFIVRGVPPGQYRLWVRSVPANDTAEDDAGPAVWGHADVWVGGRDVSHVVVSLQDSAVIAGRVVLEAAGGMPVERILAGGSIVLTPTEPPGARSRALRVPAPIESDGTFRAVGVTPGRYTVDVSVRDSSWRLMSARAAGRDLFDAPIVMAAGESISDAVLTLTKARQRVSGRLSDSADQPLGGMRLVVFPQDRRLWQAGSRRIRTAKTATDGTFVVDDLPTGRYRVGALTTAFTPWNADVEILGALEAASVPFALDDGENHVVNIRLAK